MKKLWFVFFMLFIPLSLCSQMIFPDSTYMVDTETSFKIMLGLPPRLVEKQYGDPKERKIQYKYGNGREYWIMTYDDLEISYETRDMMITTIGITNKKFCTSKGIKVGDSLLSVVNTYGNPAYVNKNDNGLLTYVYKEYFKEINHIEGECTTVQFIFLNDVIVRIYLSIVSEV